MIDDLIETLILPPGLLRDLRMDVQLLVAVTAVEGLLRGHKIRRFEGDSPNPEKVYHDGLIKIERNLCEKYGKENAKIGLRNYLGATTYELHFSLS